jgi:hypothetical protein
MAIEEAEDDPPDELPERNVRNTRMGYDMYLRDEWRNAMPK